MHDGKGDPALAWPFLHIFISLCVYMSGRVSFYLAKGKRLGNTGKRGRKTRHCPPPPFFWGNRFARSLETVLFSITPYNCIMNEWNWGGIQKKYVSRDRANCQKIGWRTWNGLNDDKRRRAIPQAVTLSNQMTLDQISELLTRISNAQFDGKPWREMQSELDAILAKHYR